MTGRGCGTEYSRCQNVSPGPRRAGRPDWSIAYVASLIAFGLGAIAALAGLFGYAWAPRKKDVTVPETPRHGLPPSGAGGQRGGR